MAVVLCWALTINMRFRMVDFRNSQFSDSYDNSDNNIFTHNRIRTQLYRLIGNMNYDDCYFFLKLIEETKRSESVE